ncbi:ABC transporter ATP-binding protein [Spirosoma humi]
MKLAIQNIGLEYPSGLTALKNINLEIGKGLFGLLGENGAGKSSLMRILATLQCPTQGTVCFNGQDIHQNPLQFRRILGYLPQEFGIYPTATAQQLLTQIADMKGITDRQQRQYEVEQMLHQVNLWAVRHQPMRTFSGGMRQRFGIAQALLAQPQVVIVDEPTTGLDPTERNRLYDLLAQTGENAIVVLSTHLVEDVSTLCSRLAIVGQGEIRLSGKPTALIHQFIGRLWEKEITRPELDRYKQQYAVIAHRYASGQLVVTMCEDTPPLLGRPKSPTLEDVYFATLASHR